MPIPRRLALPALPALLATALCLPLVARAQPGEEVTVYPYGTLDLQLSTGDERALEINAQRRGNSPLSHLQANLFADITVGDRLVIFNQITLDPSARAAVGSYLRTWLQYTLLVREQLDLRLQVGKLPTVFGNFTERAYTDKNALLGYPLMYHYFSSLRANQLPADNADLLAHRGQGTPERFSGYGGGGAAAAFSGLPMIYDSCWDFGGGVIGSLWRFEYLLAVTQGSLSDPKANAIDSNDGLQVAARLGFVPATGVLLRLSWARAPYLNEDVGPFLPTGAEVEDYVQEIAGVAAQVEWRHLAVVGEIAHNRWESPYIIGRDGDAQDLEVTGFYLEGRWTLRPGWFVAGRLGGLRYGDIFDPGRGADRSWDLDVDRTEVGTGYWLTDGVLAKLALQRNRVAGPEDDATVAAANLTVRF